MKDVPVSIGPGNIIDFKYDKLDPKKLSLKDFQDLAKQFNDKLGKNAP